MYVLHQNMNKLWESIRKILHKNEKRVLGRWNLDDCTKRINQKVDLSNEDHCGPCGQYILQQQHQITKNLTTVNKNI